MVFIWSESLRIKSVSELCIFGVIYNDKNSFVQLDELSRGVKRNAKYDRERFHCIKYARIRICTDLYSPAFSEILCSVEPAQTM